MSNSNMYKVDDDIEKTVARLMKNKSRGSYDVLNELRSKYDDEALIGSIMNKYKEKMRRVKKIAEKIFVVPAKAGTQGFYAGFPLSRE